jgi:hypothetical protein
MTMPTASLPSNDDSSAILAKRPHTALKRRSVVLMIVFTLTSFGLYYPLWFLRRRPALNQLDSPRKLQLWPPVVCLAFMAVQLVVAPGSGTGPGDAASSQILLNLVFSLAELALAILMVVQSLFVKDILEDHMMGPRDAPLSVVISQATKLSSVMTFLFGIYYLQYEINRLEPPATASVQAA